jgi:putative ABC transport system ATP-binding protein
VERLVSLQNLSKIYEMGTVTVPALRSIDLDVQLGQYVAIMGPSGSGKSTILNMLGCLDRPTSGRYWLGDRDVSMLEDDELSDIRGQRIGFIFQSFNLIGQLSALQNIEVPMFYQGVPRHHRHPRARALAELVGLGDRLAHKPNELSGGQRQRVAIARALANDPLILLADEPTGNLDSATSLEILDLFEKLYERGRTLIMVTHDDEIATRAQRVVGLRDGRIDSDVMK